MTRAASLLAKLSRPRLHGTVLRERLFLRLDDLQAAPVTLVSAPPGAGKTTLVASYLESRKVGGIWFQMDAGDRDPSTFFYYLGLAESALPGRKRRRSLPLLTPEYTSDLPGFARRSFRELFSRLAEPAAIVFDNFQEVGEDGPLHAALSAALDEIPPGIRVFLISRHPPPDRYVRLAANRAMGQLGWDDIRLTRDEVADLLATIDLAPSPQTALTLYEHCDGWAAGLLLLAEHLRRGQTPTTPATHESLGQVFAYFADQFFDGLFPDERRMLMRMSFLPAVSDRLARDITNEPTAAGLLARLYRRHLFTDLRSASESRYVFHALFRTFLQHRARTELTEVERRSTARRAAELLQAGREPQEAMALYVAAGDFTAAEALVRAEAASLIGQGRWKVVVDWIDAFPSEHTAARPWLLYWVGSAWSGIDPARARAHLQQAHTVAIGTGEAECAVLSAAGMVDSYFLEYVDFVPLTPWLAHVDRMFDPGFRFSGADAELRAHSAMIVGCTYRDPDHPHVERCVQRVRELLSSDAAIDVNLRVAAGTHLMLYGAFMARLDEGLRASAMTVPLLSDPSVHLFRRMFAWAVTCWYATCASDQALGGRAVDALESLAREEGMHIAERFACILGYYLDVDRRDTTSARKRIDRFEAIMIPSQPYEVASLVNMKSWHGLHTGDVPLTRRHSAEAVRLFESAGSIPHIINAYIAHLWGCVEAGDQDAAVAAIEALRRLTDGRNMAWGRWAPDAAEAVRALRTGDEAVLRERLGTLFGQQRDASDYYAHQFSWCTPWASALAVAALQRDVFAANVVGFARTFRLPSPDPTVTTWPWAVRIVTLGRFEVQVDGAALAFTGRAPRRTLLLLKALIAMGSRGVRDFRLIDALWPDEEGDVARDAFRVALHRLRKLLVHPDTIVVEDGQVSLNLENCWVDAVAFERALQSGTGSDLALRLYEGEFLPDDRDEPWSAPCRERLKQRYLRRVHEIGERREGEGRHDEAAALYAQVLEADPTAEAVACGLMRCHHALGRIADALSVYHRLSRSLQAAYDVPPGPAARSLYEQIRAAASPGEASA